MSVEPEVSVSVVSHGQGDLVAQLMRDLAEHITIRIEALITINVPETFRLETSTLPFPTRLFENSAPRGFGANHNAAFRESRGRFFCVLNPDIRLSMDPFPALLAGASEPSTGVVAPLIRSPGGEVEDNARCFPTPFAILGKALFRRNRHSIRRASEMRNPDWVAGMFMLFRREVFGEFGGFDERYFLYYEDVDLCARMYLQGKTAMLIAEVSAIHDARRQSHRDLRYFKWHLRSMVRFFASRAFLVMVWRRLRRSGSTPARVGR